MSRVVDDILRQAKICKNVLIVSDDFDEFHLDTLKQLVEDGDYFYNAESNYFSFKLFLVKDLQSIKDISKFDAFLVDYGVVGTDNNSLEILEKMTEHFGCVIWCGGLAGRYNIDAKKMFPDAYFIHDLPECSISSEDILHALYHNLKSNTSPSEFTLRCINIALKKKVN